MQELGERRGRPKLKEVVVEASRALAQLDADRLGELALSCQALNRELAPASPERQAELAVEAREAAEDMVLFARVLQVTRANLNVMRRLRELRGSRLDYGELQVQGWSRTENRHGDN